MTAPELTHAQKFAIGAAADEAYEKLRWHVGDSRLLFKELLALAGASFREGLRQATTTNNPEQKS